MISIHAAREGGDATTLSLNADSNISIHAAREGGDDVIATAALTKVQFQSTPPVKAAT